MKPELIRIEIERIVNLVAGFGWTKKSEEIEPGKFSLTLEKVVPVTQDDATA